MTTRIVFSFDERSLATLKKVQAVGNYKSLAEVVRVSLATFAAIQSQSIKGYTELRLRNPETKDEAIFAGLETA